jgi:uncharacterized membrane protein (UPF0127 family)
LRDEATGSVIAERAREASTFRERLVGLLGRRGLPPGEALLLRANGVHTFGMRFSIDVVILDKGGRVLRVYSGVRPNRVVWPVRGGFVTLELADGAGSKGGVRPGDRIAVFR